MEVEVSTPKGERERERVSLSVYSLLQCQPVCCGYVLVFVCVCGQLCMCHSENDNGLNNSHRMHTKKLVKI